MYKRFLLLPAFLCLPGNLLHAQGHLTAESSARIVRGIIHEKLRTGLFSEKEFIHHVPAQYRKEARHLFSERISSLNEVVISGSAEAESEVHAALNPLDSNNWVCSSNTVDPNGSGTNDVPVNHIYYTNDFGSTWTRSGFDPLPVVSGVTIAGGGDPNFAYDKNGRVYTSWINLYLQGFTSVTWQLLWAYSDDGGANWQRGSTPEIIGTTGPITALFDPTQFNGPIADKEWLAVDRSNSSYQNTLYCAYYEAGGPANLNTIAVRKKSAAASAFASSVYVT
ncbi:MAG TPA: sialidase family protein, partial [Bacteroidia bacterium]|nr:sialidase family protein [Bacteroidia bacterium]